MPDGERPPYGSYAVLLATFAGGLAGAGAVARLLGREPQEQRALDLAVLAFASFKAARVIARDEVASVVRAPFVEGEALSVEDERPAGTGMHRALGELVTCSRCIGTWVGAGLATTQILAPRFGRLVTWSLGAAGLNDSMQAGFTALTAKANELEARTG